MEGRVLCPRTDEQIQAAMTVRYWLPVIVGARSLTEHLLTVLMDENVPGTPEGLRMMQVVCAPPGARMIDQVVLVLDSVECRPGGSPSFVQPDERALGD